MLRSTRQLFIVKLRFFLVKSVYGTNKENQVILVQEIKIGSFSETLDLIPNTITFSEKNRQGSFSNVSFKSKCQMSFPGTLNMTFSDILYNFPNGLCGKILELIKFDVLIWEHFKIEIVLNLSEQVL